MLKCQGRDASGISIMMLALLAVINFRLMRRRTHPTLVNAKPA